MKQKTILILFLAIAFYGFSQDKKARDVYFNNTEAIIALNTLEKLFDIKFSYPTELFQEKKITLKKSKRTLDDVLFEVSFLLHVQFNKLNSRYIYITQSFRKNLNEVIVKSYLIKGISKNKNASFKLNPKKLGLLPGLIEADVIESIQQLPGVVSIDETATGLSVRGGTSDQNRIIWDGINIYHNGHLFGMVSAFNPNIAENITFYNKGTNAKFGNRISSVIDISVTNKIANKTSLEMGFNGIDFDILLEIPIIKDKLSLQTSYRKSYYGLIETFTFDKYEKKVYQNSNIDHEFFNFKDYHFKFNYKINKNNKLSFSLIHIDNDFNNEYSNTTENASFSDILDTENDGYSVRWNKIWNDKVTQETSATLSHYRLNYNFQTIKNNIFFSDFSKENNISDFLFSTEITKTITKNKYFSVGYQNSYKDVHFLFKEQKDILYILDKDNSHIDVHTVFGSYYYKNKSLFDIYIGARASYYMTLNSFRFEPRIIINKELNKHLKFQFTGEIKNQIISQIDETVLSDFSLERKLWRLADGKNFPIINSIHLSSGLTYIKNKWTFDVDIYRKKTTGITALSLGFLNPNDNTFHIGKQRVNGIDFYLKKDINNSFKAWFSYSFLDVINNYENLNNSKSFTANTEIRHSVTVSTSYKTNNFLFSLGWKARSGKPLTDLDYDANGTAYFDGINTETLPFYHRLDFSSTYGFYLSKKNNIKAKAGLSIRNVYNNKNLISVDFTGNNAIDDSVRITENHSIGFTPNFLFRLFF